MMIAILVLAIGVVYIRAKTEPAQPSNKVSFSTVQNDVAAGAKLYDVRTSQEYTSGHFADAANWSLQDMQAGKLPDVAKDTKIYVYCRSGNRSGQATTILKNAGYISSKR